MSVHRRPVGRGRLLAALGAIVVLIGCVPPWWTAGSAEFSLPAASGNAFEGPGIAVFVIALATLALITLPYAGDRPVALDRGWTYAGFAVVGWAGLILAMAGVVTQAGAIETITPDRAPGLWLTIVGLAILSRAAWQIMTEPGRH